VTVVAQIGGLVACLGMALLLGANARVVRLGSLAGVAAGLVAMGVYLLPDVSAKLLAAGALGGAVVVSAGAWLLLRWPYLLPFAILACLPIRLPVDVGSESVNLLLPLYAVVGALWIALGWQLVRGDGRARELGPVTFPLGLFVAWTGASVLWTDDPRKGTIFLAAFVIPFGLLAVGIARLPWRGRMLTWLWGALVGTALAYALVGAYQWVTRDVFWNPGVIVSNTYAPFFRVNSVFWDPSVYGRYLAVAILATLAGILLGGVRGRNVVGLYVVTVATWLGLLISFSQSSFAALAAGIVVAAAVAWGRRAVGGLFALVAVAVAVTFAVPQVRSEIVDRSRSSFDKVTSGRSNLVAEGLRIAAAHPLQGVGVGGFVREYSRRNELVGRQQRRGASHTTPVTVAAEGGVVALALFAWLLVAAFMATLRGLGRGFTSRVSLAVGVALAAIAVHSLFYSAFFEDPMTWALFGLAGLGSRVPRKPSPTVGAAEGNAEPADYAPPDVNAVAAKKAQA
jgi:putative inorganic carbon (hco3(-)) transporter